MFSTRYFCRWMLPVIMGIIGGYLTGTFVVVLPRCRHRKHHPARANGYTNARNRTVNVYRYIAEKKIFFNFKSLIKFNFQNLFRWEDEGKKIVQEKKTDSGFLYVAMMSAAKYLDNRALAAAETWARESVTWFKEIVIFSLFRI